MGAIQVDPSRHNWKIIDWGVKNQIESKKKKLEKSIVMME